MTIVVFFIGGPLDATKDRREDPGSHPIVHTDASGEGHTYRSMRLMSESVGHRDPVDVAAVYYHHSLTRDQAESRYAGLVAQVARSIDD